MAIRLQRSLSLQYGDGGGDDDDGDDGGEELLLRS